MSATPEYILELVENAVNCIDWYTHNGYSIYDVIKETVDHIYHPERLRYKELLPMEIARAVCLSFGVIEHGFMFIDNTKTRNENDIIGKYMIIEDAIGKDKIVNIMPAFKL